MKPVLGELHLVVASPDRGKLAADASRAIDAKDIVRETLVIVRECGEALMESDQLLLDLVTSLVVVRLRKATDLRLDEHTMRLRGRG